MKAEVEKRLEKHGVTGLGRDFVVKALDPVAALASPGIPDPNAVDVLRPEYRVQATVAAPPSATSWDLYVWTPPGDFHGLVWAAAQSPADFSTAAAPVGATWGAMYLQPYVDLPGTVGSLTVTSGSVSAGPTYAARSPAALPWSFRHMYKSVTAELVAAAVNDQGTVYCAQYPYECVSEGYDNLAPTVGGGFNIAAVTKATKLPLNENDMTLSAPECYVGVAKKGVYMPHRLSGPSQPYCDINSHTPIVTNVIVGGASVGFNTFCLTPTPTLESLQYPQVMLVSQNDTGTGSPFPWINNGVYGWAGSGGTGNVQATSGNTGFDNMNVGVMIWRGLGGSGGGGFTASVMFKMVVGLEVMPRPTSIDRVFCKPACPYDPRALEAYYAIALELDDAYPASYNAFGAILPLIGNIASKLWPTIKTIGSGIAGMIDSALAPASSPPPPQPERQASVLSVAPPPDMRARISRAPSVRAARVRTSSVKSAPKKGRGRRVKIRA